MCAMTKINDPGEKIMLVEELMATVNRLGNHELVAQTRFALEADGIAVDPAYCMAAFVGVAYTMELAERAHDSGALSIGEMVASQQICSLSMQIWATLHYQLTTGNLE